MQMPILIFLFAVILTLVFSLGLFLVKILSFLLEEAFFDLYSAKGAFVAYFGIILLVALILFFTVKVIRKKLFYLIGNSNAPVAGVNSISKVLLRILLAKILKQILSSSLKKNNNR